MPTEVLDEERAFARFAGGCVICTTIDAEELSDDRVVFADADVVCVAPFWSGAPYELLLMPRRHEGTCRPPTTTASRRWAGRSATSSPSSTRRSVTCPTTSASTAPRTSTPGEYHWHVHLWPNLVTQAGFERGTGVMINVVPPEDAAASLRVAPPAPPDRSARSGRLQHWSTTPAQRQTPMVHS